jgi:penicillin amidase
MVRVERDDRGIPTIYAENRCDVARAIGFLHAQERFFQMDLLRRMSSGELSELFGPGALALDKKRRLHGFRSHAQRVFSTLSTAEQQLLTAYTDGVNAGLNTLVCRPFEYLLLRAKPRPWKAEDSILVGLELYFDLQDADASVNRIHEAMRRSLPREVFQFFVSNGSVWDAPLDHSVVPILPVPSQERQALDIRAPEVRCEHHMRGSNQWAVAPECTKEGKALFACDMHLPLSVPNIWYRCAFEYPGEGNARIAVNGISLPGIPGIIIGSNHHIAWGFTNGTVETSRCVTVELDPSNPQYYLTSYGREALEKRVEQIKVKGGATVQYTVLWSKWGPIHPEPLLGKQVAIRWLAHDPSCFNLRLFDLETVTSTEEALKLLPTIHLPVLNFMAADSNGHIGWGLVGGIPGTFSSAGQGDLWTTDWEHKQCPVILNPVDGYLWTANNRVIANPMLGNAYLNPIRAFQIRQRLFSSRAHTIDSLYAIQLDDEAVFFERWAMILKRFLDVKKSQHREILKEVDEWDHRCSASSKGYYWIRTFREFVIDRISRRIVSLCFGGSTNMSLSFLDVEEPVYRIISQQPASPDVSSIIDDMVRSSPVLSNKEAGWGGTTSRAFGTR